MSERKRQWWKRAKENPEQYNKTIKRISENNAKNQLGKRGNLSTNWKGGRYEDSRDGYVLVRNLEHPFKRSDGYVLEHRLVVEKMLGRYLLPEEDVNHLNGKKNDNRPENLRLVRHYAHYEEHTCPKCDFKFLTR